MSELDVAFGGGAGGLGVSTQDGLGNSQVLVKQQFAYPPHNVVPIFCGIISPETPPD